MFFSFLQNSLQKTPVSESLLNKVSGLQPATLLRKDFDQVCFSRFQKILKNIFFLEHLQVNASAILKSLISDCFCLQLVHKMFLVFKDPLGLVVQKQPFRIAVLKIQLGLACSFTRRQLSHSCFFRNFTEFSEHLVLITALDGCFIRFFKNCSKKSQRVSNASRDLLEKVIFAIPFPR